MYKLNWLDELFSISIFFLYYTLSSNFEWLTFYLKKKKKIKKNPRLQKGERIYTNLETIIPIKHDRFYFYNLDRKTINQKLS